MFLNLHLSCSYPFTDDICFTRFNPFALRKAKIVYNFGFSKCNRDSIMGQQAFHFISLAGKFVNISESKTTAKMESVY